MGRISCVWNRIVDYVFGFTEETELDVIIRMGRLGL